MKASKYMKILNIFIHSLYFSSSNFSFCINLFNISIIFPEISIENCCSILESEMQYLSDNVLDLLK